MDNGSLLKQLLLMGVGTTSLIVDGLTEAADELVKTGRLDPIEARQRVEKVMEQIRAEQTNVESQIQRTVRNVMQDLGVPRQAEMDELRGRLDRLERQVRSLEDKLYRRS